MKMILKKIHGTPGLCRRGARRGRLLPALLAALLAVALASGCAAPAATAPAATSGTAAASAEPAATSAEPTATSAEPAAAPGADGGGAPEGGQGASEAGGPSLPITTEDITLTYFMPLNPKVTKTCKDYSEVLYYQELEKRTGIKIRFIHPAMGSESEQLNLAISSGDLPDLCWQGWTGYPGGYTKALKDGIATDLREPIEQWAPNLMKTYEQWPVVRVDTSTDNGEIVIFPIIYVDMEQISQSGFFMRYDWLEKLGLEPPETMDDWHAVLTAFKTQDPNGNGLADEIPFSPVGGNNSDTQIVKFASAWRLDGDFLRWGDHAVYSPLEPDFKIFVETMREWYAEGLIDPQYLANDQKMVDDLMGTSVAGSAFERNSKTSALMTIFKTTDPDGVVQGVRFPVASEGGVPANVNAWLVPINQGGATISRQNKYVEESVKWFDYLYSDEGFYLGNWGPEGAEMTEIGEDGLPRLTEYATSNPDGLSMDEAICRICPGGMDSARRYDPRLYTQRMMIFPQQFDTAEIWDSGTDFSLRYPNVSFKEDEVSEVTSLLNDINTYKREMMHKMIMGQIGMDQYDTFIATMKGMGADRLVEYHQSALDRYLAR
ncbi:MAG: extracellular solute-binding protein [Clostridiales bacterium]|nr:extracellular solute-binding protein [Clostridiales bacterium]